MANFEWNFTDGEMWKRRNPRCEPIQAPRYQNLERELRTVCPWYSYYCAMTAVNQQQKPLTIFTNALTIQTLWGLKHFPDHYSVAANTKYWGSCTGGHLLNRHSRSYERDNITELLALRRKYSHVFHDSIETVNVCLIDSRPQGEMICEIVPHKGPKVGPSTGKWIEGISRRPGRQIGVGLRYERTGQTVISDYGVPFSQAYWREPLRSEMQRRQWKYVL